MWLSSETEEDSVLRLCQHHPNAVVALGPAALNPDQLNTIKYRLLHRVLSTSNPDAPIRVWVPCAADGLAAYALGAIVLESSAAIDHSTVRIYGTDTDRDAILAARIGAYKFSGPESVPLALRPHVNCLEDEWWVTRHIRKICVFAEHDTLLDPPFPNLNAIICSIPQISEESVARRALPLFHYSLSRTGGYLMAARQLPEWSQELFDAVDEEKFIYRWRPTRQRYAFTFPARERHGKSDKVKFTHNQLGRLLEQTSSAKEEANEYERILETAGLPFLLVDSLLRLRQFHGGSDAPFKLTLADRGKTLEHLTLDLDRAELQKQMTGVMLRGEPVVSEIQDRQGRWFSARISPHRDVWGGIEGALVMLIETTAQHELQRQAETARDLAEATSRAKDQFLAVISHELRTPLAPVMNWTRLLRHAALSADQRERALQVIERNVQVQRRLIEDLLDVSRIIAGKMEINFAPTDVSHVVEAAMETVRSSAEARRITFNTQLQPGCTVRGDPDRLQQVFWNLLSNAVKFSQDGLAIDIDMRCEDQGVTVRVIDHGDGIDSSALPHIFEKFWQADSSSTRRFGGLGLGLTIVRTVVELHGGRVRAESAGRGQGTCFEVFLPLNDTVPDSNKEV